MTLDAFNDIKTYDELQNLFKLLKAKAKEVGAEYDDMFDIVGVDLPNMFYVSSSIFNGNVIAHWFSFSHDERFYGLVKLNPLNKEYKIICDDDTFVSYNIVTSDCITARCGDGTISILGGVNQGILFDNIVAIADYGVDGYFSLFRLVNLDGSVSLLCVIYYGVSSVFYSPADELDFKLFFFDMLIELSDKGYINDIPISYFIEIFNECKSCCFLYRERYKRLFVGYK